MDVYLHFRLVGTEQLQSHIGRHQIQFEMVESDQESSEQVLWQNIL